MRAISQFWTAIANIPGLSGVLAEWREYLGNEFSLVKPILKSTGRKSRSYPCPSPGGPGCPREVVEHRDGSIVAVCGDQEERNCDDVALSLADIFVYTLDRGKLAGWVAQALAIEAHFDTVEGLSECWHVGDYTPFAGRRFPVYMLLAFHETKRAEAVQRLCRISAGPFMLAVPIASAVSTETVTLLQAHKGHLLRLDEMLMDGGNGRFAISQTANEYITAFHDEIFPQEEEIPSTPAFPTPPNATWRDLRIRFLDGHRATLLCQGVSETVSFSTMGMENRRSREPSVQWELLEKLAQNHGRFSWQSSGANNQVPQQVRRLNKDLERFFGIDNHPVEWKKDEKAYCTLFEIHYEPDEPARSASPRRATKRR
ncbi:MAG: hypothetical protein HQL52_13650 [Magnetococcales bacterium]|nr:hypothetical protein [Magnetococcales bacterium]